LTLGSKGPAKAARHVAADLCSALCGVGPDRAQVIRLATVSLNQLHSAASAIAAFQLSQFCFSALVQNGIVPKLDAERLLRQAVQTNKTGGPGNKAAADLLAIFLDQVTKFQPPTRQ